MPHLLLEKPELENEAESVNQGSASSLDCFNSVTSVSVQTIIKEQLQETNGTCEYAIYVQGEPPVCVVSPHAN